MKRLLFLLGTVGLFYLSAPHMAMACTCGWPDPPSTAFEEAGLVFAGTMVGVPDTDEAGFLLVTFRANRVWKGPVATHLQVRTAPDAAVCGFSFQVGETYLVYASDTELGPLTSICNRTRTLAGADEDLAFLGHGTVVSTEPPENPLVSSVNNYPNPFARTTTISFTLAEPADVSLKVYDLRGRLIKTTRLGFRNAGTYEEPLGLEAHPAGIYWYEVQTGTTVARQSLLLIR